MHALPVHIPVRGVGNRMCYPCKEYAVIARSQCD